MTKKNTSIWIEPRAQEKLKALSKKWGKPIGDIIDGLTRFADRGENPDKFFKNPTTCKHIKASFETCMANAGSKASWEVDQVQERIMEFETVVKLANEANDKVTAASFEARIKAMKEEYGIIDED